MFVNSASRVHSSYPAAKANIPELANVRHVFVKASARINNRAKQSSADARARAPNAWLPSPREID
ncbi:hypothetical protein OKW28_000664 [Paraburkholderia sp. 40]